MIPANTLMISLALSLVILYFCNRNQFFSETDNQTEHWDEKEY